mgnify:FL=1
MIATVIVFIFLLLIMLLGVPVVVSLGITGILFVLLSNYSLQSIPSAYYEGINSFVQLAVPFFVLTGELMSRAKLTEKLIDFAKLFVGRFRGGLAYINIFASMLFAGLTGAGVSDVSALGTILIPAMEKEGYDRSYAALITAVSSIIGPTIPPSIIAVIYGAVTGTSIGGMLMAIIVPGILIGIFQMITVKLYFNKHNLPDDRQFLERKEIPVVIRKSILALFLPIIIIFGILGGIFTPTEAAAVSVFYALFLGLIIYKNLTSKDLYDSLISTVKVSANMYMLMAAGGIITWVMARTAIPTKLANLIVSYTDNSLIVFFIGIGLALFLGLFMDNGVALILIAPVLTPLVKSYGIPEFQFGAAMIVALNIGLITPPFGMCLFAASSVGNVKYESMLKYLWPFLICSLLVLILCVFVPELTLFLPRLGGFM